MRKPLAEGSPIDTKRYRRWINRFGSYRDPVTRPMIEDWLSQFKKTDTDLAARILDSVEYFGNSQIWAAYREALDSLQGWSRRSAERKGEWRFAAMSSSAGESGDGMLYQFRLANSLDGNRYKKLFVGRSELVEQRLGPDDTVVLLDDFSGTGKQICQAWNDPETAYGELLANVGRVYVVVVAASKSARMKITAETRLSLVPAHELNEKDCVFSESCVHFSAADRKTLLHYGAIASKKAPKGYGECGFVVVFQHRTPNNSIPILHVDNRNWSGLFPRHV